MKPLVFTFIFTLFATTANAQEIVSLPLDAAVILIEGQSNACGQAGLRDNILSDNNRTFLLHHGGTVLRPSFDPVCSHRAAYGGERYPVLLSSPVGIGPVVFMQNKYQRLAGGDVATLTYAVGSTTFQQRQPNLSTSTIYGAGMALLTAQLSEAGLVIGGVSMGGETDARIFAAASNVAANLEAIINGWRLDLIDPALPVAVVALGDDPAAPSHPYWDIVRDQQFSLAELENVVIIDPAGLAKQADGIHYTKQSYQIIGEQVAAALFALQGDAPPVPIPDPPDPLAEIRQLAEEILRLTE